MSANTSLAIRIAAIFDNKGLKQADKGVKGLQLSVKKLAGAAGIGLGAAAIVKFGKSAAKAFIEDQKEVTRLATVVKNLGLAFEAPAIEDYISKLSRLSGVTDSDLRPSMQTLLQITGSVTESQKMLSQAIDISAATGIDLSTVAQDLGRAYTGNTKGLKKYNIGLTQTELKTATYVDVQSELNKLFGGSNAAQLGTYAGQMSLLNVAAGEATETIGKGLIDAMITVTDSKDVTDFVDKIDSVARSISNAIGSVGRFTQVVKGLFTGATPEDLQKIFDPARLAVPGTSTNVLGIPTLQKQESARKAAEAAAAKRAKEIAALQKKGLATQTKALALQKASKALNLEAIGIEAALKGKISETDRISLLLQKAILEGNATLATQLSDQLNEAVKRNNDLKAALLATPKAPNPYADWYPPILAPLSTGQLTKSASSFGGAMPDFNVPANSYGQVGPMGGLGAGVIAGVNPPVNVTVTIDGKELTSIITDTQINNSLSGSFNQVNRGQGFKGAVAL
jgi:hypothetical protein